ncbi:MAG: hypothetical protein KY450_00785, partial [Actinobacteria bacterium]|nr:hypothetical protein [Actinomycetota bacterium]
RWPDHPVVALAYLDQLQRSAGLAAGTIAQLRQALEPARARLESGTRDAQLASRIQSLAAGLAPASSDTAAAKRVAALRQTLTGIAAKLG